MERRPLRLRDDGWLAEDLARRRLVHADARIDSADRLEQRGDAHGSELFEQIQRTLPRELLDTVGAEIDRRVIRICL